MRNNVNAEQESQKSLLGAAETVVGSLSERGSEEDEEEEKVKRFHPGQDRVIQVKGLEHRCRFSGEKSELQGEL